MLTNSDWLPWLESHFNAGPATFWSSKWTDEIKDAMFLVPVSGVWCAQLGHKFLVTISFWYQKLGRRTWGVCHPPYVLTAALLAHGTWCSIILTPVLDNNMQIVTGIEVNSEAYFPKLWEYFPSAEGTRANHYRCTSNNIPFKSQILMVVSE